MSNNGKRTFSGYDLTKKWDLISNYSYFLHFSLTRFMVLCYDKLRHNKRATILNHLTIGSREV